MVRIRAHNVKVQNKKNFVNIFHIKFAYMGKITICVNNFQIFLESSLGYFEKKTYICSEARLNLLPNILGKSSVKLKGL